ncbi:GNAT family N-acetyltransferase [Brucella pseudogrignonensis]|uniref:GNAT family N-acetyltransferase n=1 Tax=Brucella pseudogrignonensis TaxID=419475 RepID=UPI0028B2EC4E|nr:GNAT family N-acetyltransferase [Brucella pseudogrignonensis]MDT6941462.1 GNAT family N-acetyltransferase [Brucella pseudogrignonensis]
MVDIITQSSLLDPAADPLIDGLVHEYESRYANLDRPGGARTEILRYPIEAFAPPLGGFLLLQRDGVTIAGGAFMSHDDETVELKRIWTASHMRRQGLARRIVLALEERAGKLGYTRAYLSTGFRQPEATALYISLGYRPLFDTSSDVRHYRSLPFEKHIGARLGQQGSSPLYPPSTSFEEATQRVRERKAMQEAKILARLQSYRETAA